MLRSPAVPNVWLRPSAKKLEADAARARLTVPDGDHLTLLNVYNQYMHSASPLNGSIGQLTALENR